MCFFTLVTSTPKLELRIEMHRDKQSLSASAGSNTDLMQQIRHHLKENFGISNNQRLDFFRTYAQTIVENLADLNNAICNDAPGQITVLARSLKCGLLHLGLNQTAEIADSIERTDHLRNSAHNVKLVRELNERLKELVEWLN